MSKQSYLNDLKDTLKQLIKDYQNSKLYNDNEKESLNILEDIYYLQDKISEYDSGKGK